MNPWIWISLVWVAALLLIWGFLYGATRKRSTPEEQDEYDNYRHRKVPRHESLRIYDRLGATREARNYQAETGLPVHVYVCIAGGAEHYHVCKIPKGAHWHSGR